MSLIIDSDELDEFLQHFGRKGMKWGAHVFGTDRAGEARVNSEHIMTGRRSAGKATSPRQATAIRKSSSGTPLRPAPASKNASREQQLIAKAAQ